MKKLTLLAVSCCLLLALAACEKDFVKTSYTSLSVMANTYNAVMSSAGDAYKRGLIDEAAKSQIVDVGNVYKSAFDAAALSLKAYVEATKDGTVDPSAKEIAIQAFSTATASLGDLTALYTRLTSGIKGIKSWKQH